MSGQVWVISDLHLGHHNILKWAQNRGGTDTTSHDAWIIERINTVVKKKDTLWILGDIAFNVPALRLLGLIPGYKKFVLGNHDQLQATAYMRYGRVMPGIVNFHGMWLSHAPVHPQELRGMINVHGHVHNQTIPDPRYVNVCVEALHGVPINLKELIPNDVKRVLP